MEHNVLEQILKGSLKPTHLELETLRKITDDFSVDRIIGEGGFGVVYKGVIGNENVAVKRIRSIKTVNDKLFRREVDSQLEVNHENVVRFLGLCSHTVETPMKDPESQRYIYAEIRERLLCFEYVSNGSLDKYITDELRGLEWDTRYQIIRGICAGLQYLHMEKHILHMDLKPANILLDNQMVPKITDFGLSRPVENPQTMTTNHFSTPCYGAPENLFGHGSMTVKSDIYSLGAIIIELITGCKGIPDSKNNILRRWRHRWSKSVKETPLEYHQQVTECIKIASWCLDIDVCARPSIKQVMSKIALLESTKVKPFYWEDDMLGVEPLDIQFVYNKKKQIFSCSVELSNDTNGFIAFKIETNSPLPYSIVPEMDIVKPRSKCSVNITVPAVNTHDLKDCTSNRQYTKALIVQSIRVSEGLTSKEINQDMFDKNRAGNDVDEFDLAVDFSSKENMAEEVHTVIRMDINYSSEVLEHIVLNQNAEPVNLPLELLQQITEDFADKRQIGRGGYGITYKGDLQNGSIAIKRLLNSHTINEEPFYHEANCLFSVKHQNIVRFLGYCANTEQKAMKDPESRDTLKYVFAEIRERLLCFEYISNGSLDKYLTDELRGLEWHIRYQIIRGICDGLVYLHKEKGIVHRDMKPANILLDDLMIPKITGFGVSKFLNGATHAITTDSTMSFGYCGPGYSAPEFLHRGVVSIKSDIYSLGVIIIELVTGCKDDPDIKNVLRKWRYRWNKSAKYPLLGYEQVTKCIDIALRCLSESPKRRPYVWDIVNMLNELESLPISPYPWEILEFDKLELNFPFSRNKLIPCSLELTNVTHGYVAFKIEMAGVLQYCLEPDKGVVPPRARCNVVVTLQAQERAPRTIMFKDEFVLRCAIVNEGLVTQDITEDMFDSRSGKVVDEVTLKVVFSP